MCCDDEHVRHSKLDSISAVPSDCIYETSTTDPRELAYTVNVVVQVENILLSKRDTLIHWIGSFSGWPAIAHRSWSVPPRADVPQVERRLLNISSGPMIRTRPFSHKSRPGIPFGRLDINWSSLPIPTTRRKNREAASKKILSWRSRDVYGLVKQGLSSGIRRWWLTRDVDNFLMTLTLLLSCLDEVTGGKLAISACSCWGIFVKSLAIRHYDLSIILHAVICYILLSPKSVGTMGTPIHLECTQN